MKTLKVLAVAGIALAAAACQTAPRGYTNTTQQVYGNAHPAVPANWERVTLRDGSIVFGCKVDRCDDPGAIGYKALLSPLNTELLVRKKVITAGLLQEVGKSMSHLSNGRVQAGNVRSFANRNAVGFESTASVQTSRGTFYGASRATVSGQETRSIVGVGTSPAKARRNLQLGIRGAK